jgi:hypothetical protein
MNGRNTLLVFLAAPLATRSQNSTLDSLTSSLKDTLMM